MRSFDSIDSRNKLGSKGYSTDLSIWIDCTELYAELVEFKFYTCSKTIKRINNNFYN